MIRNVAGYITHVHDHDDWAGELCECQGCGYKGLCKPTSDYYVLGGVTENDKPLHCSACMWSSFGKKQS